MSHPGGRGNPPLFSCPSLSPQPLVIDHRRPEPDGEIPDLGAGESRRLLVEERHDHGVLVLGGYMAAVPLLGALSDRMDPRRVYAVAAIIAAGIIPVALEFMDRPAIHVCENFAHAGYPDCEALLIVEVEGAPLEIDTRFFPTLWAVIIDLVCLAFLLWIASGLYMWWGLRWLRRWGSIALAAGLHHGPVSSAG